MTVTVLKKPSKLVAMQTILEGKAPSPQPPLLTSSTNLPSTTQQQQQQPQGDFDTPPRFRAAKLKLALGGPRTTSPPTQASFGSQQVQLTKLVDSSGRDLKIEVSIRRSRFSAYYSEC